jgi:hypothetical protein
MTCFKVLGWPFSVHIFDQHTAYLAASNILLPYNPGEVRKRPRKGLADYRGRYRSETLQWGTVPRQAACGEEDVADDDVHATGDRRAARRTAAMRHVYRHGRRIAVDTLNTGTPIKKRKPFAVRFVKLPNYWIQQLQKSNSPGTFKLAHSILKEALFNSYRSPTVPEPSSLLIAY